MEKATDEKAAKTEERATELEWLKWFYSYADFGPADGDMRGWMRAQFEKKTGKAVPEGYASEEG